MKSLPRRILLVIFIVVLSYVLFWRYTVSTTRFLDNDEFSHMSWSASIARGEKPFLDFFSMIAPGFHWIYSLLFHVSEKSSSVFLHGRYLSYLFFLGNTLLIGILFSLLRNKTFALLAMMIFAWLPMPYDKLLEIRPDNVSLFFCLFALAIHTAVVKKRIINKNLAFIGIGFAYAYSLIVLVKMVPFVFFGLVFLLVDPDSVNVLVGWMKKRKIVLREISLTPLMGVVGFMGTCMLFFLWMLSLGNFPLVWYSLTKLVFEANSAFSSYIMEPHLFFFPNASFYGPGYLSMGLIGNHAVWATGIIFGSYRLLTPFVTAKGDKKSAYIELLMAVSFFALCFLYVQFYVLKHIQYLIPISVFIAFYAADAVAALFQRLNQPLLRIVIVMLIILGMYVVVTTTQDVNQGKLAASNTMQLKQLDILIKSIPPDAEVFDLEGRLVYWKNSYYICCLPFMTYVNNLSRKPEPLINVLERKKTPYIYQGDTNRFILFSPEEINYIQQRYDPVDGWGNTLWMRKKDTR